MELYDKKPSAPKIERVVSIKGLRKQNFPYIFIWAIYYAWVVSFATWWTASPLSKNVFSTEIRSLMHTVILITSGIFIFIIRKEHFIKLARIGAVVVIIGIGVFYITTNTRIQLLSTILIGIALGLINTSILMPFVFILNNTEKLYAVVSSNILISLISIFHELGNKIYANDGSSVLLSIILLAMAFSAILFFRKEDQSKCSDVPLNTPAFQSRIYLTLLFNCILAILCKGFGKGILNIATSNSQYPVLIWHYLGGLIGCILYLAIYAHAKKPFIWMGNVTFSFFAMGLFLNAFVSQIPILVVPFAILLGAGNSVGMINVYYILGVVGKKYNNMNYIKLSILFIGMVGGVSGVLLGNFIHVSNAFIVSIIVSIISVGVMFLFIALSSFISQTQYYEDWALDSEKIEIDNEHIDIFKKYGLSKREIEVCKLLLKGYTMRQISGILSIAYSTVNTYCTSLYRKLGINSKTELLILFKDFNF